MFSFFEQRGIMNEKQKKYQRAIFINNILGFALAGICGWCLGQGYLIHALCAALFHNAIRMSNSDLMREIESELYCDTLLMNANIMAAALHKVAEKDCK